VHFVAILNQDGGTLKTTDLDAFCRQAKDVFEEHGHSIDCRVVSGDAVERTLRQVAVEPGIDVMIAGGGDGTISSAAGIAFEHGRTLAVLPAGTMNLFARALKMPLDLVEALHAIATGQIANVDIATANGRPFVHQFGVGIHARLVRIREQMTYGSRVGKMMASLRAIAAAAMNPPQFDAELMTERGNERRRVSGIAVSNNPLGEGQIHADTLDQGVLGVYVAATVTTAELLALAVDVFAGRWRANRFVTEKEVRQVTLAFPHRKRGAMAVIDGELARLEKKVELQVHPGGLKVVRPAERNSEA
jgi:diacylglycerol kinase family enzyme